MLKSIRLQHDEHVGYYVRIPQNQTRELREYLNEIRVHYFVSPPVLQDKFRSGNEDLFLFGSGVKQSELVEVLSFFYDGEAEVT
jgi:hypothetical protein